MFGNFHHSPIFHRFRIEGRKWFSIPQWEKKIKMMGRKRRTLSNNDLFHFPCVAKRRNPSRDGNGNDFHGKERLPNMPIEFPIIGYCNGYRSILFVSLVEQSEEGSRTENLQVQRCRARLDHLDGVDIDNQSEWSNMRVKRILVDYMLRLSYYDSAMKLAESSNIQVIFVFHVYILSIFLTPKGRKN